MRRTAVLVVLGALLGATGVVTAAPAMACSCAGGTAAQFAELADAVFTGRLVSREVPEEWTTSADPAVHVFAVDTVIEGTVTERQEILSPSSGAACGLEFSGEGPFVVFGTTDDWYPEAEGPPLRDGQYFAYLCHGSAPLTPELEAELAALGPATPPAPEPQAATVPADDEGPWPVVLVAGAAVVLGAGARLVSRRRRS